MTTLDRIALIVRPKRRFVDWVNGHGHVKPKLTIDEARTNPSVYLVDTREEPGRPDSHDVVETFGATIFEAELGIWLLNEDHWPADVSAHAFRQYFDVELADDVQDLAEDDDFDEDDDVGNEDDDLERASDAESKMVAIAQAFSYCAWCGKELGPSQRLLPIEFEAFHPETLQAERPIVPFPLPKAGKVLTGVLPPPTDDEGDLDEDEFDADVLEVDEPDTIDVEAGDSTEREPGGASPADPAPAARTSGALRSDAATPPMVVLMVCSEKCRAKLVVAVEEEKEAR